MQVEIDGVLKNVCPDLVYGCIQCSVTNTLLDAELWDEIRRVEITLKEKETVEMVKRHPAISSTREAYKETGKDPNRYRSAGEQLRRRILQGKSLFQINTLVDLVNLLSLETGFSIGGFDASLIRWPVRGGIGNADEEYFGIGRGKINVAGMPIIRDKKGGIGTPTSDEVRTALSLETKSFFMLVNSYLGEDPACLALNRAEELLVKYVNAEDFERKIVR